MIKVESSSIVGYSSIWPHAFPIKNASIGISVPVANDFLIKICAVLNTANIALLIFSARHHSLLLGVAIGLQIVLLFIKYKSYRTIRRRADDIYLRGKAELHHVGYELSSLAANMVLLLTTLYLLFPGLKIVALVLSAVNATLFFGVLFNYIVHHKSS
jgi:hypothetical protein